MDTAIKAIELTKRYGDKLAVDNIDFEVMEGEFFGMLGPNGAGKTTTIRMLTGLTKPTKGKAIVAGYDVYRENSEAKRRLGLIPEISNLYSELTAWDNIMFMAELYQVPKSERAKRARELLELFDLYDRYKQRVMKFSKGLKRRLTIALALVHSPEILFLDEPTAGLDVQSSRMIRTLIKRLNKEENTTIFLTTHYIEEADELCQRVAIINKGKIVALDNPEKLKIAARGERVIEVTFDKIPNRIEDELMHMDYIGNVTRHGDKLRLFIEDPSEDILSIANFAQMKGLKIISITTLKPTLEEAFIELTGLSPIMIERLEQMKPKGRGRSG